MTFRTAVLATSLILVPSGAWAARPQTAPGDDHIRIRLEAWLADHHLRDITVTVHQRHVTLGGTVPNAWARRQAFAHARTAEDVTSVTCELVVPPGGSDAAIAMEVERRVTDYAFYTIYENVEIAVQNGRVTLTGQVMAETSVSAMADIAARVNGVREVFNRIHTLAVSPGDDAIRHEIAGRFYDDPRFSSDAHEARRPIRIVVEHGRVMLTGIVDSEVAHESAEVIARSVPGVIGVDNKLTTRLAWSYALARRSPVARSPVR